MKRVWSAVLLASVALGFVYFTKAGHAPADQPAIMEMNGSAMAALQAEFNGSSGGLRALVRYLREPVLLNGPVVDTVREPDAIVSKLTRN